MNGKAFNSGMEVFRDCHLKHKAGRQISYGICFAFTHASGKLYKCLRLNKPFVDHSAFAFLLRNIETTMQNSILIRTFKGIEKMSIRRIVVQL